MSERRPLPWGASMKAKKIIIYLIVMIHEEFLAKSYRKLSEVNLSLLGFRKRE